MARNQVERFPMTVSEAAASLLIQASTPVTCAVAGPSLAPEHKRKAVDSPVAIPELATPGP